jgi:Cerato-platanin
MFYFTTFILALLFTPVAHGLPQQPSPDASSPPASSVSVTPTCPATVSPPAISTPSPLRATYDPTFDNSAGSMNSVACSNGPNGLASRFPTFGSVPSFPFIGGAYDVQWNSPNCGGCWNITNPKLGTSVHLVAIDTSGVGFNLAKQVFSELNGGNVDVGVIEVTATKIAPSVCGL